MPAQHRRRLAWPKVTRDGALFLAGLALITNEALRTHGERPYLLMIFAGMMGLPVFLRRDEKAPPPPKHDEDGR